MYFISITFGCATSTSVWQYGGFSAKLKFFAMFEVQ